MPTGYTKMILDGCTFKEFVVKCSTAFGYLHKFGRNGQTPPNEIDPDPHHKEQLEKYEKELEKLNDMNPEEIDEPLDNKQEIEDAIQYNKEVEEKYNDMLEKVNNWNPPSDNHKSIKKFMKDQIKMSKKYDTRSVPEYKETTPEKLLQEKKERCQRMINYHREEWQKELKYNIKQNKWWKQLRESL